MKTKRKKSFIGIITSFTDLPPASLSMPEMERFIEKGVHSAGGYSFLFRLPSVGEIGASSGPANQWALPCRELVADFTEAIISAYPLEGLVLLAHNERMLPGMIQGAIRANIPTIVVPLGPVSSDSVYRKQRALLREIPDESGAPDKETEQAGLASQKTGNEEEVLPDTMAALVEALGLTLPGGATASAFSLAKRKIAFESGLKIVMLVKNDVLPKSILSENALVNAIRVDLAMGGYSNSLLHLRAMAAELDIQLPLALLETLSRETPVLLNLQPQGEYGIEDFDAAGGISALLSHLRPHLKSSPTVSELDILEIAGRVRPVDSDVIRSLERPYSPRCSLTILAGNIAPRGCVARYQEDYRRQTLMQGKAKTFRSEGELMTALKADQIREGDILVMRYFGPRGGPGMPELRLTFQALKKYQLDQRVALITDGRLPLSAWNFCVSHVTPEAIQGGVIALIENGDEITLDMAERRIHLHLSKEELQKRLTNLKHPPQKKHKGYLGRYAEQVTSALSGAILRPASLDGKKP
jgi:dihydroxy-acid dehydratase